MFRKKLLKSTIPAVILTAMITVSNVVAPLHVQAAAATQPEPDTPLVKQNIKQKFTVKSVEKLNDGVKFDLGEYDGIIHVLDKDIIKVSIIKDGEKEFISPGIAKVNWEKEPFSTSETDEVYTISTEELTIQIKKDGFGVKFLDKKGNVINEDYMNYGSATGYEEGKPFVFKKTDKNEDFYGFGEQTGKFNKRGASIGMWNTDAYSYDSETKYIYTTIPFFIGLKDKKAYGIFFDNTHRSYFEMASESDDFYYFYANGGKLTYYFVNGPEIQDVIDNYTELTGKIEQPAEWTLGLHQSKWQYTADDIKNVAETYREKKIPIDTMHFDIDYMDQYRIFTWSNAFGNPDLHKKLDDMNFHKIAINDPAVKIDENYSIYKEGTEKNYWAKNPDGTNFKGIVWPGETVFPDFSKKEVRNWWANNHKALFDKGIDGIWNDMNEPAVFDGPYHTMPLDVVFGEGENQKAHTEYHNLYGHDEADATHDAFTKLKPNTRPFVLTRDMYAGTQRYAALWTGDNVSNWEHLKMTIPMNTNIGLSGVPFVGNDIGGFAQRPTAELFARWIEVGAFLPFSRIHYDADGKATVKQGQEPWAFGKEVEDISRKYITMRYQLLPYLYNAFHDAAKTAEPVQQPLVYQFQDDANTYDINDQFMFGKSMMLAPVVTEGTTSRQVYLPDGETWVDWWTGEEYKGGQTITKKADLGTLPIYVKKDAIIPMREAQQYTGEKKLENLTLDTYLDQEAKYSFYEDDAETLDYKSGEYNITDFTVKRDGNNIFFTQDEKVSKYQSDLKSYTLKLHNEEAPKKVQAGSEKYAAASSVEEMNKQDRAYFYDTATKTLYVKIPVGEKTAVHIH